MRFRLLLTWLLVASPLVHADLSQERALYRDIYHALSQAEPRVQVLHNLAFSRRALKPADAADARRKLAELMPVWEAKQGLLAGAPREDHKSRQWIEIMLEQQKKWASASVSAVEADASLDEFMYGPGRGTDPDRAYAYISMAHEQGRQAMEAYLQAKAGLQVTLDLPGGPCYQ